MREDRLPRGYCKFWVRSSAFTECLQIWSVILSVQVFILLLASFSTINHSHCDRGRKKHFDLYLSYSYVVANWRREATKCLPREWKHSRIGDTPLGTTFKAQCGVAQDSPAHWPVAITMRIGNHFALHWLNLHLILKHTFRSSESMVGLPWSMMIRFPLYLG